MRDRIDQAELDFDACGTRSNVITDTVESLFMDEVEDLEPEPLKKPGKWMKAGKGFEVYVEGER